MSTSDQPLTDHRLHAIEETQKLHGEKLDKILENQASHGERFASLDGRVKRVEDDVSRSLWGALGALLAGIGALAMFVIEFFSSSHGKSP